MAISDDIAALTTATNSLLAAVNVSKNTLDTTITNASAATVASAQIAALTVGTYPNAAATTIPQGVQSFTTLVGGSGGTNGTFSAAITGGAGTGATATFVVSGGALTSITITNAGTGYTSAPTIAFTASSGLTGASATLVIGTLVPNTKYYWASTADGAYIELYQNNAGTPLKVSPTVAIPSKVQLEKIQSISVPISTYTGLAAITGLTAGMRASVLSTDTGTHTDPVVGGTVSNAGIYTYSTSPAGWQRTGDLDSQRAVAQYDATVIKAAEAAASATLASTVVAPVSVRASEQARKSLWQTKQQALLRRIAPASLVLSRNIWVLGDSVSGGVGSPVEFKNLLDVKIANNCVFTGYSSGTTLTVTAITSGTLARDQAVSGNANYRIVQQLTGTTGGVGTYELANLYTNGTSGSPVSMTSRYFALRDSSTGSKTVDHLATMTAAPAWKKRADTIETSGSINDYAAAPVDRDWAWSGTTKATMDSMQALLTDGATFFIFHVWSDNASQGLADVEYHVRAMRAAYGARFIDVRAEMVADVKFAGQTGPDDYGRRRLIMPLSTFAGYGLTTRNRNFSTIRSYNTGSPVPADYSDGQILDNQFNDCWAVKVGAAGGGTITSPLDVKHPGEWGHRLMDFLATDLLNALNNLSAPFIPSGHKALVAADLAAQAVAITLPVVGSLSRVVRADIIAGDDDGLFGIDRETLQIRRSNYGTLTEGMLILVVELEDTAGNTRQCDVHLYVGMPSTQVTPRFITMAAPVLCSGMTGNDVPSGTSFSMVTRMKVKDRANIIYIVAAAPAGDSSYIYIKIDAEGKLSVLAADAANALILNQTTQAAAQAAAQSKAFRSCPINNVEFTLFFNVNWATGVVTAYVNDDRFFWGSTGTVDGTATTGGVLSGDKVNWKYGYLIEPRGVETANQGLTNGGGFGFLAHRTASDGGIDWTIDANRRLFMNADLSPAYTAGSRPEVASRPWDIVVFNGRGLYDMLYGPQPGDELTRLGFNPWRMSN